MDDYVSMPRSLTAENGAKAALMGEFSEHTYAVCDQCLAGGCEDCDYRGVVRIDVPVSWTVIKEIYVKAVELFAVENNR